MKNSKFAKMLLVSTLLFAAPGAYAGPGQIGSAEINTENIEAVRTAAVKNYILLQSSKKGSVIEKAMQNVSESVISTDNIKIVQTDEVVNGHPVDSYESRSFLVVIPYLAGRSTHFDDNDQYRSNTARFSSLRFQCDLEAKSFGSKAVKIACTEN